MSLPLWERGLKSEAGYNTTRLRRVAPLVGAWIEIACRRCVCGKCRVAPLVGAWIEIILPTGIGTILRVAPLVGAWIEISAPAGSPV